MLNQSTLTIFLTTLAMDLFLPNAAHSAAPVGPRNARITEITYSGQGCNRGVEAVVSGDKQALTLLFDDFSAELTGRGQNRASRSCTVNIELSGTRGWSFIPLAVEYRGYADVDRGATGFQRAAYRVDSQRRRSLGTMNIPGEFADNYRRSVLVSGERDNWTRCSKRTRISLTTVVGVNGRNRKGGFVAIDSVDSETSQNLELAWKPCNGRVDRNRKYVAYCQSSYEEHRRFVEHYKGKAAGSTRQQALKRAKIRSLDRCARLARNDSYNPRGDRDSRNYCELSRHDRAIGRTCDDLGIRRLGQGVCRVDPERTCKVARLD